MADLQGPVCRLCRREGMKLFLKGDRCYSPKCSVDKRPYPPGPHQQRRRKVSDYGVQLREKQKTRHIYGVLERQFRRHFAEAERQSGATGENLLRLLEMRLDSVVRRMGFADAPSQARQLVTHGHFQVNGRKAAVPSYQVKVGDVVSVKENSRKLEYFKILAPELGRREVPTWLSLDPATMSGRVLRAPSRNDVDASIQEALVVEYYSR